MIRRKWTHREIGLGIGFLLAMIGLLTFYIWYQTEAVRLGIDIGRRREGISSLRNDIRKLELRKTALLSPERVERIARGDLGLIDSPPEDIIYGNGGGRH
jgi:cell division protein FtsL